MVVTHIHNEEEQIGQKKMYSLDWKGALGTLMLHMLSESVIIKEMNATEQGTGVHENNVEGA